MRHHRGATARRRSFKSKAPLWIATEHREQGRADIRQRIEKVRLVPLADVLEQTCWVQNWAVTTMWKELPRLRMRSGLRCRWMTPDCFTASLEPGTNVGLENPPSAADHIRNCRVADRRTVHVERLSVHAHLLRPNGKYVNPTPTSHGSPYSPKTCDPETYACR